MIDPKSLLMPLSTSGHVPERISGALSIAKYFGAHLEVMHAQVSPSQFLPDDVVGMPTALLKQMETLADKYSQSESEELVALFNKLCDEYEVVVSEEATDQATAFWREINGLRSELVAERGKVADAIICPQSKTGKPTSTFEAAIMRSGKPVILVPRTMTQFKADTVLIAWNGSTEAARAVTHALPILSRAKQVVVATSLSAKKNKPGVNSLQRYLRTHGIDSEQVIFDKARRQTGEALLELYGEQKADLIVMGGYTHRRVHEQIFGGVTQHMVAYSDIPVFMMH